MLALRRLEICDWIDRFYIFLEIEKGNKENYHK